MKKNLTIFAFLFGFFLVFSSVSGAAESASIRPTHIILEEIVQLLNDFQFDDAIALFETMDPEESASPHIMLLKASVLSSAGKTTDARSIAEEVSRAEPGNLDALFVLSAIEGAAGRTREQLAVLERIIQSDPENITALLDLASLHVQSRSINNAILCFDQVLEIDPENLDGLLGRAQLHRLQRDPHGAEELLNKAVVLYPQTASPYHERARLYRGMGFLAEALDDLDRAKELDLYDYWIAMDRGHTLLDLFMKAEALEDFERAAALRPRDFLAYVYIAGIKDDLKDHDGAGRAYEILAALNPDYYFGLEGHGLHSMRNGQWLEARDAFAEAYRRAPNEYYYALLAASSYMRVNVTGPRQFLNQAMTRIDRDSIEFFMFRLFFDLTGRTNTGENDMLLRIERETNEINKARMSFYMGQYYDIRGIPSMANRHYQQFKDMNFQSLPEWRLNEWILAERGLIFPY